MSVAFPTHVWKMANICKHIILWLFSHMCAFSHTYVSKSKHVWKKDLGVNIATCLVFFPNMLGKSQTSAKMHMCGILRTGLSVCKHICKKPNIWGKKYYVSTEYSHIVFLRHFEVRSCSFQLSFFQYSPIVFEGFCDKILLISVQSCLIYFPFHGEKKTISFMTSILQNLSHFDQQHWPQ